MTLRNLHINSEWDAFYSSSFTTQLFLLHVFLLFTKKAHWFWSTLYSISKNFCVCITCQRWFVLHVLSIPRTIESNCITAYKGVPVAEHTIVSSYSKFSSGWCLPSLKHSTTRIGKKYCWKSYLLRVRRCSEFCLHFITFGFHYFPCFLWGRYWVSAWKLWFRNGNLVQWQLKFLILNISAKEQSNKLHTQTAQFQNNSFENIC